MAEAYVTLNEAAELEGIRYNTFVQKLKRNPEKYNVTKKQRKGGGRELTMVAVSSLSKKAGTAWKERERLKESVVSAAPEEKQDIPWYVDMDVGWYQENHKKEWYKAMELGNAVREFLSYDEKGRTESVETFAQARIGKGRRTLYRYVKSYQEASAWAHKLQQQDGCNYDYLRVLCLCRKPKEAGMFPSFKPEVRQAIKNIWFNRDFAANLGTREMLYEKLQELAQLNHWEKIPSYPSVARYIHSLMEDEGMKNAWYLASHGVREYKNKVMGKALMDTTVLMPMEVVMGDEHTFDCWVQYRHPNGKVVPIRPVLVAWIDVRSRRILGDIICHHANSEILKDSLLKLINTPGCGVPEYLLIDNGKDYTAKVMTGIPRGIRNIEGSDYVDATSGFYGKLGISHIHRALPYQPWTKAQIERFFGSVCSRFTKWMKSYTGTLTGSRTDAKIPKDIQGMCDRGELLTMEEFYQKWQEWLYGKYETTVHRGLKDAGEQWTKPMELFENAERYFKPAPPKSAQIAFMHREDNVRIRNYGFKRHGKVYDHPELRMHTGETLSIRYDRNDISTIFVISKDGKTICEAECRELLAFGRHVSEEALLRHMKEQRRQYRKDREILEDASVPFEEIYEQYVGFSSHVGGIDLMVERKGQKKDKVVSMPLDNAYRSGFRGKKPGEPAEGSEYISRQAEEALKALRAN